ncbi:fumarylacetoacetate hydrolase family protein [Pigmentiphaga sp. GD03639]|uniref:fumarylacetoacetate hydrolase family protein n=1 Tax=unclassified Pigmentiphaga TaxID=2626614 RepID=UPI000B408EF1|nr:MULTISPECIES: fumarylacetoacetate hydrolase family protein [unclassified Pigmentiphaga]MDH2235247.1 fumarylacetoacetate hydrolase family protein [Pigmentiphaga sp. GD03639]OVZ63849.1 5-oxopent-3-ene-1,2,5-tricarboxylate decarboxylase [Pigmentiphaga sp. NML030171]
MRLIAFKNQAGAPALGARIGNDVVDLTARGLPATLDELLRDPGGLDAARAAANAPGERLALAGLALLPPLQHPAKAFAIGLNYVDHAAESNFAPPAHPVLFQRFPSSWVAHGEAIERPRVSEQFDYEAELVAVIGKGGRYIPKERALEHVAGYSLFNEGSIRDYQFRSNQWLWGKNFDRSGGFGPEFVTADELPAGAAGLRIQCRLNGQVMQDANTRDMIFDVATLVAACSEGMALQPGDMIITGTPSGVGLARKPPVWLKPGDVCEIEIEGVGVLRNPVIDEA